MAPSQGTGRGGQSIYGDRFEDEIVRPHPPWSCTSGKLLLRSNHLRFHQSPELRFTGAGILAVRSDASPVREQNQALIGPLLDADGQLWPEHQRLSVLHHPR